MSQNLSGLVAPDEKRKSDFQETNEYPGNLKEIHAENGYSIDPCFSPERATSCRIPPGFSPRRKPFGVPKLQNEFFVTSSLLTVARGNFRSSDTAKFNARCEDFFSARAYLHQEAIFAIE